MRGEEFLDKMELIAPEYIEEAETYYEKKKSRSAYIAACALVLLTGILGAKMFWGHNDVTDNLPKITIPKYNYGGMGYENYSCYNISQLTDGNPWSGQLNITSLPVYKNNSFDETRAGVPKGLSKDDMMITLESAVNALQAEIISTEIIINEKDPESITEIIAETSIGRITASANGQITYTLPDGGMKLPGNETAEDYLLSTFRDLLNFEAPNIHTFTKYTAYGGKPETKYIAYDSAGDITEDILNYNFQKAEFNTDADSDLHTIRIYDALSTAEIIGNYPIITLQEATEKLLSGQYQTSSSYEFPGESYIGKAELIYRTGPMEEMLLPYYRFYVLFTERTTSDGLKTYGVYYVPALADKYIDNMPTYDGRFN